MSEPTFAQAERRSIAVPIVLALLALGAAVGIALRYFAATSVDLVHVRTEVLPTTTVFKADSIVVGQNETDHTTFVATTVRLKNAMRMPVFVEDSSLTLTDATGAELTVKGLRKQDLATVEEAFPKVKPLAGTALLGETAIEPGRSFEGTVVFSLRVPESVWNARRSAVMQVDLYHQPSVIATIPKT